MWVLGSPLLDKSDQTKFSERQPKLVTTSLTIKQISKLTGRVSKRAISLSARIILSIEVALALSVERGSSSKSSAGSVVNEGIQLLKKFTNLIKDTQSSLPSNLSLRCKGLCLTQASSENEKADPEITKFHLAKLLL